MKTNQTLETDNLVLFPSSKNYSLESDLSDLSDPLMDLLNEYAHIKDDEIPSHLDDRFDNELEDLDESAVFGSLEAFMGRNLGSFTQTPEELLALAINEKMEAILEARQKIKFYLDEIEMFLPRKKG
jgi:cell fate (sporulation/competence/biofilm development) regulator YlbF (YheA/YmcA/DUF963 family)